jgi:hypothetical protein
MVKTVFSTVDDLNVNWLKMELQVTFWGYQDEPRQTRFRSSYPEFDIKRVKYLIFIGVTYKTSTTEGSFGYFG